MARLPDPGRDRKTGLRLIHSIGVDYGGTWLRVLALDSRGEKIRSLKTRACPIQKLPAVLKSIFKKWRADELPRLTVGAKGVWTISERRSLHRRLKNLAHHVVVISDAEWAYWERFGNSPGLLIIAGTGSIALGKNSSGRFARAGGLGPQKGDEGSGFWIGRKSLGSKKKSVAETARLAVRVIDKAERKDPEASRIVREAQDHLVQLVESVAEQLRFKGKAALACAGGLFKSSFFKRSFLRRVGKKFRPQTLLRPAHAPFRITDEFKEVAHLRR